VRSIVAFTLASLFWAAGASAQSMSGNRVFGRYQQTLWQEREGLPQNTVLAVTKTRDGYVWLATYEGAARFDGVRFTLFTGAATFISPARTARSSRSRPARPTSWCRPTGWASR
jgi:ligand-binding sensor domain-containing protein